MLIKEVWIENDNEKSCLDKILSLIKDIINYPNLRLNAIRYEDRGNSHDESYQKHYIIFDDKIWQDFFDEEITREHEPFSASPTFRNRELSTFEFKEWLSLAFAEGTTKEISIFLDINGNRKTLTINPEIPNPYLIYNHFTADKRKELVKITPKWLKISISE